MSKKIAITGGIGSGKSTVLSFLKENGYPVFSCDEIYKQLLLDREYIEKIEKLFPSAVRSKMRYQHDKTAALCAQQACVSPCS